MRAWLLLLLSACTTAALLAYAPIVVLAGAMFTMGWLARDIRRHP